MQTALRELARRAPRFAAFVGTDPRRALEAIVAEIDRQIAAQVNQILHHPEFQQVEATWRGLHLPRHLNPNRADPEGQGAEYRNAN